MELMILRNPGPEPEDDATIATAWTRARGRVKEHCRSIRTDLANARRDRHETVLTPRQRRRAFCHAIKTDSNNEVETARIEEWRECIL